MAVGTAINLKIWCFLPLSLIFFIAFGFGDPHFQTLDGKNYTFNGCGWYTYFQGNVSNIGNSSLEVQVRTTKVGDANATAFTGIALKEGYSETVQVNLRSTGK